MEAQRRIFPILVQHNFFGRVEHIYNIILQFVRTCQIFEMSPEAFNRVQVRAIWRQPDNKDPVFKQAQCSLSRSAFVIGSIVHHQDHPTSWIFIDEQMFQELDEIRTVLPFSRGPCDRIPNPVVASKNVHFLASAWLGRWNTFLATMSHPTGPQRWVQRQRSFVHKDECEIVSEALFFNWSSNSLASAFAAGSCRCPKSCLGRR